MEVWETEGTWEVEVNAIVEMDDIGVEFSAGAGSSGRMELQLSRKARINTLKRNAIFATHIFYSKLRLATAN